MNKARSLINVKKCVYKWGKKVKKIVHNRKMFPINASL